MKSAPPKVPAAVRKLTEAAYHPGSGGFLAFIALASACAVTPSSTEDTGAASSASSSTSVPAPLTDPHARLGMYNWGGNYAPYGFSDNLNEVEEQMIHVFPGNVAGARVARTPLTNPDSFTGVSQTNLLAVAETAAWDEYFRSCDFDTYILTTYSANDEANIWVPDTLKNAYGYSTYASSAIAAAETAEIAALAAHLGTIPSCPGSPPKNFIIINWEGDSAMSSLAAAEEAGDFVPPLTSLSWNASTEQLSLLTWENFTSWINARAAGVAQAAQANVFSGLEFAAVERIPGNDGVYKNCGPTDASSLAPGCVWCDSGNNKCVSSYVASRSNTNYFSYSAWQSVIGSVPMNEQAARLQNDLTHLQSYTHGTTSANFIVGEFGADRNQVGDAVAGQRVAAAIQGMMAFGVSYGNFWQALDNAGGGGFGAYLPSLPFTLTASGQSIENYYLTAPAPVVSCVYNDAPGSGGCGTAPLGGYISVYGTGFGANQLTLAGVPLLVTYSGRNGQQINAELPTVGIPTGNQTLVIYDASSQKTVSVTVDVVGTEGSPVYVVDYSDGVTGTAHLGSYVELYGTFGASDTVSIAGVPLTVTYTSASQINAQVPTTVPLGNQTLEVTNVAAGSYTASAVDVFSAGGAVSCVFTAPTTIADNGTWPVSVTSSVSGYGVYWSGTHNGVTDATMVKAGGVTPFSASYGPFTNVGDTYTRWAVLLDGSGNAVCTTSTISVSVQ